MAEAVAVRDVSKSFRLPHEHRTTLKEYFLHPTRHTTYEENRALDNVSFSIEQGEFYGIIGANGSGKSTLLKILAGIYPPDAGRVEIAGRLSPFIELGVGFNPELPARDNIMINGTLLGLTRKELQRRFDDIVGFAELERFVDQKLKNFSSGMQVRLAYSIAIQVLDEVLAVGDQSFQEKCQATFDRIRSEGKTIVFVSHDLASITHFADRVLLLEGGRVASIGGANDVVELYLRRTHGEEQHLTGTTAG
jgi:ABC-type polysaccharide/polyol phosphate transport system ATPase subunit